MSRPPTLLLVANYRPDAGFAWWLMESFWVILAEVARAMGMHPLLVYPLPGEVPGSIRDAGIETVVVSGSGLPEDPRSLLDLVRARNVRAIYFTDRSYSNAEYARLRAAGVRRIAVHDHTPGDRPAVGGLRGGFKRLRSRVPWVSADEVCAVSPYMGMRAAQNGGFPASRISIIQNGIVPIVCGGPDRYLAQLLEADPDSKFCVTVARADPYKRVDFVVDVARVLVHERGCRALTFVHCGDGPELERLKQCAIEAGVERKVLFLGRRSDVRQILCAADFALHPAKGEAFSLAILEYMSAGVVTFVPDVPSVCQAVSADRDGIVYRDGDARMVASVMLDLLADHGRRERLQSAARETVASRYSLAGTHAQLREWATAFLAAVRP